jgi:ABC-2 type transport system ATP-binding protein
MNHSIAVKTNRLAKEFDGNKVLKNCEITVQEGEIYGFLGANGAGKTTVFKILTGLMKPTSGTTEIFGESITEHHDEILRKIGSLIEVPVFYEHLSAKDNLQIHLSYMGVKGMNISEVLQMVGLADIDTKPVAKFSLGMRQRLAIARAIIHRPQILILDEPINGLDPLGIKEMRNLFLHLSQKQGITILLSSHILSEIGHIADTVGVIVNGVVVQEVKLEQIKVQCNSLEDYFFEIMSGGKLC